MLLNPDVAVQAEECGQRAVPGAVHMAVQEQAAHHRDSAAEQHEGAVGAAPLPGPLPVPGLPDVRGRK